MLNITVRHIIDIYCYFGWWLAFVKNRWRLGLSPRPYWGSLRRSPNPLVGWGGGLPPPQTPPPRHLDPRAFGVGYLSLPKFLTYSAAYGCSINNVSHSLMSLYCIIYSRNGLDFQLSIIQRYDAMYRLLRTDSDCCVGNVDVQHASQPWHVNSYTLQLFKFDQWWEFCSCLRCFNCYRHRRTVCSRESLKFDSRWSNRTADRTVVHSRAY